MKVLFVVGPTASGKSAFALELAARAKAAIVNCDSVQVYRGVEIGAAQPSVEDFAKAPHHLYGFVTAPEKLTAGQFARVYHETLQGISQKHPVALTVGGTGFYFQAIEKGLYEIPAADPTVQRRLESELAEHGGAVLWERLRGLDEKTAERVSANDAYRLVRALEVIEVTGRKFSDIREEHANKPSDFPWPLKKIGFLPSKENLRARVEKRTREMLRQGLVEETRALLDQGLGEWAPLSSVGYRETVQFLRGEIVSVEALYEAIVTSTLQLAKKQRTWFQRDRDIQWFDPDAQGSHAAALDVLEALLDESRAKA